jgi:hypothetical protein
MHQIKKLSPATFTRIDAVAPDLTYLWLNLRYALKREANCHPAVTAKISVLQMLEEHVGFDPVSLLYSGFVG